VARSAGGLNRRRRMSQLVPGRPGGRQPVRRPGRPGPSLHRGTTGRWSGAGRAPHDLATAAGARL
jgi:hypothetical protein